MRGCVSVPKSNSYIEVLADFDKINLISSVFKNTLNFLDNIFNKHFNILLTSKRASCVVIFSNTLHHIRFCNLSTHCSRQLSNSK